MQMSVLISTKNLLGLGLIEQAADLLLSILELLKSLDLEVKVSIQSYDESIDSTSLHTKEVSVKSLIKRLFYILYHDEYLYMIHQQLDPPTLSMCRRCCMRKDSSRPLPP